ncbi:hypothetical protein NGB36_13990 [Streptomyces sp. RB6PN25]|uniref:Uncharacterized protein n=1 Tax=Streptomyces humicola TaxID=2953240 RepID=A0ABT1PVJ2_9ACTN|nr:hypothetical protein [Streptomyces humicola]MCQ4081688.1 hypothetical protein [Streptomyces humicola]
MREDFETILRSGSAELAARTSPRPAGAVRARGDQLRRRHSVVTTALAVVAAAAVGGGAFAATGLPGRSGPSSTVTTHPATSAPSNPSDVTTPPSGRASVVPSPSANGAGNSTASCRSLVASPAVKDAVTAAYRQSQQGLVHIEPVKGTFYYGTCGGVTYAGTRFMPAAGSTLAEQVALQDAGGAMKYFVQRPGGTWIFVAGDGLPASPLGCAAISQIPSGLATAWGDCLAQRTIG